MFKSDIESLNSIKRRILRSAHLSGEGHIPSSLSILDILYVYFDIYFKASDSELQSQTNLKDSTFVLSKGHASLALYAVLWHFGKISGEEMDNFSSFHSILGGHPDKDKVPFVKFSTGSLGHGLPLSVGVSMARKLKGISGRVFCLVGDGELNEGSNWESILLASHHKLSNLTCIVDNNGSSARAVDVGNLNAKFLSFGWDVLEVDGHDHLQLRDAFSKTGRDRPFAVVCSTIKGHGIQSMSNNPAWHHKSPSIEEYEFLLRELQ